VQESVNVTDLPTEFTWKDHIGIFRNQEHCGSCYIFATLNMVAARLSIKYDEDVLLSV